MMDQKSLKTLRNFRIIAIVEGISYLVLLFIAMPLKYYADLPKIVTYVGWAHGALFVAFMVLLVLVQLAFRWSFVKFCLVFISSLIPFGTFILDKSLKEEEQKFSQA